MNPSTVQEVCKKNQNVVRHHIEKLDKISNDIRFLEKALFSSAIPFEFRYLLNEAEIKDSEENMTWWLIWCDNRLNYTLMKDYKIIETRPLIEQKTTIRLSLEKELTPFLESVLKILESGEFSCVMQVKSPNFKYISRNQ